MIARVDPAPPHPWHGLPPPWVTRALLASIVVAYVLELLAFREARPISSLVAMGANLRSLTFGGQLDRLVTANWLHAPSPAWLHTGANALGLFFIGTAMERLLGAGRFFVLYVLSCLGGAFASALFGGSIPSLGASTGVAGLFAAIGYVLVRFRHTLPFRVRGTIIQWVVLLVVHVALWVVFSSMPIDHAGHAGGFIMGAAVTAGMTSQWPPLVRTHRSAGTIRGLAIALAVVVVAGLGVSTTRFFLSAEANERQLGQALLQDPRTHPEQLNNFAWFVVIDGESRPAELRLALNLAERAVELAPEESAFIDTHATTLYRLGRLDEAIDIERAVYEADPKPEYASQLARFLFARVDRDGPPDHALSLRIDGDALIAMTTDGAATRFYAVVIRDHELQGLIAGSLRTDGARRITADWLQDAEAIVAWTAPDPTATSGLSATTMDPTIATYP